MCGVNNPFEADLRYICGRVLRNRLGKHPVKYALPSALTLGFFEIYWL